MFEGPVLLAAPSHLFLEPAWRGPNPRPLSVMLPPGQVYEAVFLMATRQFKRAAELLLDAIATFTRQGGGGGLEGKAVLDGGGPREL